MVRQAKKGKVLVLLLIPVMGVINNSHSIDFICFHQYLNNISLLSMRCAQGPVHLPKL